jgi:hypothetical protein
VTAPTPWEMAATAGKEPLVPMSRDEAIGYALLETDHLPGFARRGPDFAARLEEAGWRIVPAAPTRSYRAALTKAYRWLLARLGLRWGR